MSSEFAVQAKVYVQCVAIPVIEQVFAVSLDAGEQSTVQQSGAVGKSALWRADGQLLAGEITAVICCETVNGVTFRHVGFLKMRGCWCFRRHHPNVCRNQAGWFAGIRRFGGELEIFGCFVRTGGASPSGGTDPGSLVWREAEPDNVCGTGAITGLQSAVKFPPAGLRAG